MMFTLPWNRRAEEYEAEAEEAFEQAESAADDWDTAIDVARRAQRQRETNGWTGHLLDIFAGHQTKQVRRHHG
jgi:hypothetical protein